MDTLRKQVRFAHRRLVLQQFIRLLPRCLFVTLLIALAALAAPKVFPMAVEKAVWAWAWLGGAVALAVLAAAAWTWLRRESLAQAALEIDRRCRLKERVSSMYALSEEELQSPVGQALAQDALRRAGAVDVTRHFRVRLDRRAWLPAVPAVLTFALVAFVPDREPSASANAATGPAQKKQVKRSAEVLRKKLAERRKQAEEQGLKDAAGLFKKLENGTKKLADKSEGDRKKALVKLNDLARQLEKRQRRLGGSQKMREQFNDLKDIRKGPADKLAKAMREGDFKKAQEELKKLQERLRDGKLDQAARKQLAEQMQQMQQKLQQMADAHQQAMDALKEQIKKAAQAGDVAEAARLQRQLDQLAAQGPQMDKLRQMAQQMGEAAKNLQAGDGKQAAQALDQIAQDLKAMQKQLDELQMLDQALDQIAQAKDAMACKECNGEGCKACQGGLGDKFGQKPGNGLGAGRGFGLRPEEKNKTGTYDTRVRQKVGRGKAVIQDFVNGPNVKGDVREGIKAEMEAARHEEADPLTGQRLPRARREHAKEYFDAFREGGN